MLLRLFETEQPRAVLVGWDTLASPNFRQRLFPNYQSGREFDQDLVEQLHILPQFVSACGFANAGTAVMATTPARMVGSSMGANCGEWVAGNERPVSSLSFTLVESEAPSQKQKIRTE